LLACAGERLDADGLVTGVCGAPTFDRPGISAEAQAFFLLASRAAQRLHEALQANGAQRLTDAQRPPQPG
jgi:unsaturated rhamnogalacturonyl hydrolase